MAIETFPAQSALLVIDMQVALVDGAHRIDEVLAAIAATASTARNAKVPVVYLQHCHSRYEPMMKHKPGWQIHGAVAPLPGDEIIEKTASDAFYETTLLQTLQRLNVAHLFITGMQTEFCVDATCRSALSHNFDVTLLSDCHTTGESILPAQRVIDYHNFVLPKLAHPRHTLRLLDSSALRS